MPSLGTTHCVIFPPTHSVSPGNVFMPGFPLGDRLWTIGSPRNPSVWSWRVGGSSQGSGSVRSEKMAQQESKVTGTEEECAQHHTPAVPPKGFLPRGQLSGLRVRSAPAHTQREGSCCQGSRSG